MIREIKNKMDFDLLLTESDPQFDDYKYSLNEYKK